MRQVVCKIEVDRAGWVSPNLEVRVKDSSSEDRFGMMSDTATSELQAKNNRL